MVALDRNWVLKEGVIGMVPLINHRVWGGGTGNTGGGKRAQVRRVLNTVRLKLNQEQLCKKRNQKQTKMILKS